MRRTAIICTFIIGITAGNAAAQISVGESGTLSGTMFGDLYLVPFHHNEELEGNTGFWFRRIYLTYDRRISDSFSSRLRLEMNNAGDFASSTSMFPSVKDAWLKWSGGQHEILAGISPTPTWGLVEEVWGYRSVEKTPADLQGLGSSREFGLSLSGSLGLDERVIYHIMLGNGNGARPEVDDSKKIMMSMGYRVSDQVVIEVYADHNSTAGNRDITTLQGFAGYHDDGFTAGLQYVSQTVRLNGQAVGEDQDILSLFTHFPVSSSSRGLFRIDHMFEANPGGEGIDYIPFSNNAPATLILGGIDLELDEMVHLVPNLEAVIYGEDNTGNSPDSDLIARLTLAFDF